MLAALFASATVHAADESTAITIYSAAEAYSWPLVRVATGLFFLPHGMQKLFGFWGGDIARTIECFAKQGLNPAVFWAYYIGCLEFFGGICLILGLLTRPVAALFAGWFALHWADTEIPKSHARHRPRHDGTQPWAGYWKDCVRYGRAAEIELQSQPPGS